MQESTYERGERRGKGQHRSRLKATYERLGRTFEGTHTELTLSMKLPEHRHPHLSALEAFEDGMRAAFEASGGTLLRPRPDLLHVIEPEGDTFISAVPICGVPQPSENEAKPVCMITVTSSLKDRPRLTDELINACNRFAAMSLLTRQSGQQQVMAVNSFTIYDDAVQRSQALYLGLQTTVLQRTWLSQVLTALEDDFRRAVAVVDPRTACQPSAWCEDEIRGLYEELIAAHFRVRQPDSCGLVLHLSRAAVRGQGSFIIVRNDVSHPFYGNGLSVSLVQPEEQGVDQEDFERRCLEWNRRASLSVLPVPCMGAWSSMFGRSQLQHQVFVPNVIYAPGVGRLVLECAVQRWAASRADPGQAI